ncbi:uncharacterized protein [Typha latifolia]|uniref:uncharacterized protein isoform X2 n=1 Tax=Typha latifolia TaxID=4733 RepID=UPI003C2C1F08
MSLRIKAVVDRFVRELKEALDADIQDRIMKEREMQSYIEEREREVAEREAAWKAELSRREEHFISGRQLLYASEFSHGVRHKEGMHEQLTHLEKLQRFPDKKRD